jgi:hypothetical protein
MNRQHTPKQMARPVTGRALDEGWVAFPGGELEGRRPRAICRACREQLQRLARGERRDDAVPRRRGIGQGKTLCFQCYRAGLDRERQLDAAASIQTASDERFQHTLPFEPVSKNRLDQLKFERATARTRLRAEGRFVERLREAQMAARRALHAGAAGNNVRAALEHDVRARTNAVHAAELQLPESWWPFVIGG